MLNNLNAEIRECHRHAGDCARQAAAQTDPKMKEEFLVMERRWRSFANGYEIAQYLTDFSC